MKFILSATLIVLLAACGGESKQSVDAVDSGNQTKNVSNSSNVSQSQSGWSNKQSMNIGGSDSK